MAFENCYSVEPDEGKKIVMLAQAVKNFNNAGESENTERTSKAFIEKYAQNDAAPIVYEALAESLIALKKNDELVLASSKAAETFKSRPDLAMRWKAIACELQARTGNFSETSACFDASVKLAQTPAFAQSQNASEAVRLSAMAKLLQLEPQRQDILKRKISSVLKINLEFGALKKDAQDLIQKYVLVVKAGNAEAGITAIDKTAEIQLHLASVLTTLAKPDDVPAEEFQTLQGNLAKIAQVFFDDAVGLLETALKKAEETEALTDSTEAARQRLMLAKKEIEKEIDVRQIKIPWNPLSAKLGGAL